MLSAWFRHLESWFYPYVAYLLLSVLLGYRRCSVCCYNVILKLFFGFTLGCEAWSTSRTKYERGVKVPQSQDEHRCLCGGLSESETE